MAIFLPFLGFAQPNFSLKITPVTFNDFPGLHSFTHGMDSEDNWIIIGGRTDGLHQRQPFASFDPAFNNLSIYKIDIQNKILKEATINGLDPDLVDQLQSSNMEYFQVGTRLYLIGGYGFSTISQAFVTYPSMIVVDLETLSAAIEDGNPIAPAFTRIEDSRMAVTGGQLQYINGKFLLIGGHKFDGAYNPHGPTHGPGFSQEYTNEIRTFEVDLQSPTPQITSYDAVFDETNLHRRDYNLAPQIFENDELGLTAFSGVFQHNVDLPFLNIVDIKQSGYTVNNDFNQLLNQYHTAHMTIYSSQNQRNTNVFFGGIGQYYFNDQNQMINDTDVPFVKTVSVVERDKDGNLTEYRMPFEMPGYLGASAEFIPLSSTPVYKNLIFDEDALGEGQEILLGYIVGGIESTKPNILFDNGSNLSSASTKIFEVKYTGGVSQTKEAIPTNSGNPLQVSVSPVPANENLDVKFTIAEKGLVWFMLQDTSGKLVKTWHAEMPSEGTFSSQFEVAEYPKGNYFFTLSSGKYLRTVKLILQ